MKRKTLVSLLGLATAAAAGLILWKQLDTPASTADPKNPRLVALGEVVYGKHCASCHGKNLEGEPDWRRRKADGTLPAPPHDDSGHTWHHGDELLFTITRNGGQSVAPAGFTSNMPAFGEVLTDEEIWASLAFIKSRWSPKSRAHQARMNQQTQ